MWMQPNTPHNLSVGEFVENLCWGFLCVCFRPGPLSSLLQLNALTTDLWNQHMDTAQFFIQRKEYEKQRHGNCILTSVSYTGNTEDAILVVAKAFDLGPHKLWSHTAMICRGEIFLSACYSHLLPQITLSILSLIYPGSSQRRKAFYFWISWK